MDKEDAVERYMAGEKLKDIAKDYGVVVSTVNHGRIRKDAAEVRPQGILAKRKGGWYARIMKTV